MDSFLFKLKKTLDKLNLILYITVNVTVIDNGIGYGNAYDYFDYSLIQHFEMLTKLMGFASWLLR